MNLLDLPIDKYLHFIISVFIFAVVHFFTGDSFYAFIAANAAHVFKKLYDVADGLRDTNDIFGDIISGAAGAFMAWACAYTV